jgi:hypothetical protein
MGWLDQRREDNVVSDCIIMEHPVSLFRVLGGNSDILFIVWRSYLDSTAAEHALNTDADGHDAHSRTPIFVQDGETDVTVTVDMRVAG